MEKPQPDSGAIDPNAPTITPLHHDPARGSTLPTGAGSKAVSPSALTGLPELKDLSVNAQDLLNDKLLLAAPRLTYNGQTVPALGGIPLLAKLGSGGMGAVYFGIHPRLKLEVAVKILPFQLAENQPDLIARFFREAKLAATVESPRLVRVTDVNEDCGLYFLVMEYVNGVTAGWYLKQHGKPGLEESVALDICIAAAEGLAAAHAEDIIHRDIKPDNIMIPRQRHKGRTAPNSKSKGDQLVFVSAKLSDLGLARGDEGDKSLTASQSLMGTPGYMAPEQAVDAKTAGKPADIFSVGATLYALLCGTTPYSGGTQMETILATIQKPHSPLKPRRPSTSDGTCALVERTLMKSPDARFADASELLAALRQCRASLGGTPAVAGRPLPAGKDDLEATVLRPATPAPAPSAPTPAPVAPTPAPVSMATPVPSPVVEQPRSSKAILVAAVIVLAAGALALSYKFGVSEEKKSIESKEKPPPTKGSETSTTTETPQVKEDPRYREEVLSGQGKLAANDYLGAKIAYSIAKSLAIKKEAREFAENGLLAAEKGGFNAKLLDGQAALAGDHMMDAKLAFQAAHDMWPESPDIAKANDGIAAAEKALAAKRGKTALKDAMLAAFSAEDEAGRDPAYKKAMWEEALKKAVEGSPEAAKIKARIEFWTKSMETKP